MKNKNTLSLCILAGVILILISCKLVEDTGGSGKSVYSLKLGSGDISPWVQIDDGFKEFKPATAFDVINGGADEYVANGLVEGFFQTLSNSDKFAEMKIMDLSSTSNATAMYKIKNKIIGDKSPSGNYNDSIAAIDNAPLSGVVAYAHFDKYYIELDYTGYDSKTDARTAAANFIQVFDAKIDALK